jgi:hypothetical protein
MSGFLVFSEEEKMTDWCRDESRTESTPSQACHITDDNLHQDLDGSVAGRSDDGARSIGIDTTGSSEDDVPEGV